jgi:S1-C subfamily serine protease
VCLDDSKSVAAEAAAPASSAAIADSTTKQTGAGSKMDSTGTGFFVSGDGYIATAAHVVDGCSEMRSPHLHLKIVAEDKASDVAILSSGEKSPYFIKLRGGRGPRVGEAVVAVGFPLHGLLGDDIIVTGGIVSSLVGMKNDRRDIQISAPTQPGNSGGPIVGEDGTLVGVLQGGLDAVKFAQVTGDVPQNVNFAVSAGTLQSFLNAHQVPYILSDGAAKKGSAEISAEASRYTIFLECWK